MSLARSTGLTALCLTVAALAGCGVSAYEERLAKTDQRNRYFARLDAALDPYWNQISWGIWLRPPKGLLSVPPPALAKEGEDEPPDLRQEFQGVPLDLPGIIQVWDGSLPTAGGTAGPYRLFLLGNHSRFTKRDGAEGSNDPKTYFYDLEVVLQNLYGVTLPNGDGGRGDANNERFRQSIPTTEEFVIPKNWVLVNFVPLQEGQQPFNAWLFEYTAGPVQFAALMLTPPNASNDVRQTLLTSLETLQIAAQPPSYQTGTVGPAPGGAF